MALPIHSYMLRVRMTDDEKQMLEALSERAGQTASEIVRQLVRREHANAFGAPPVKRQRRKR